MAERSPRVSVVIPAWNAARTLPETLDSVFAQTFTDLEVIVVDDGSTDRTPEVLAAYGDRIRVLHKVNEGRPSTTRNLGLKAARGELLALLDADDRWHPEKVAKQVALFDHNPRLGLVYTAATIIDASGRTIKVNPCSAQARGQIHGLLATRNIMVGSSAMVRARAVVEAGYYDESLTSAENWDLWIRIARSWEVDFVPEPLTYYRVHGGNRSAAVDLRQRNIFRILAKHHDPNDRSKEGRRLRREAYFNVYYAVLGMSYFERLEMRQARAALARAFVLKPRRDVARLLGLSLLGRRGFLALQRLKRNFVPSGEEGTMRGAGLT
jgi:glycosyltransferase involved in cell wall biosynthesis